MSQEMIKVYIEEITPSKALEMLSKLHHSQRKESAANTEKLAARILAGKWDINAGSIIVDKDGFVVDGQHRLRAIAKTKVTVMVYVMVQQWSKYRDDTLKRQVCQRVGCSKNQSAVSSFIGRILGIKDNDEAWDIFGDLVILSNSTQIAGGKKPWGTAAVGASVACCHILGHDIAPMIARLRNIEPINRRERALIKKTTMARSVYDSSAMAELVSAMIGRDVDVNYVRDVFANYMKNIYGALKK